MSDTIKRHIISFGVTFIASFLTTFGAMLASGDPSQWTWALLIGLVLSAARAAVKIAAEKGLGVSGDPQS